MKKRLLALFMALLMLCVDTVPAMEVQGGQTTEEMIALMQKAEPVPVGMTSWDGTADTSWYNAAQTEFTLSSPQQLAGLAQLVNGGDTFEGKKVYLGGDIFLNDETSQYQWKPIANYSGHDSSDVGNVFQGTFHGNRHAIYNMSTDDGQDGGLFGRIGDKGVVKCVNISHGLIRSGGCIAHVNNGLISFCTNDSMIGSDDFELGGICDYNYNLVYGCKNTGVVWGVTSGGIIGCNMADLAVVSQCSNQGLVRGSSEASGIADSNSRGWIYNCYNRGIIEGLGGARGIYGIVANNAYEGTVENCYSAGSLSYDTEDSFLEVYAICKKGFYGYGDAENCYALPIANPRGDDAAIFISNERFLSPNFLAKLDCQFHLAFSAWMADTGNINGGYPITVADYSAKTGQCKIQPELWVKEEYRDAKVKLEDKTYKFSLDCYYNDEEPVVTVENTDLAEVSGGAGDWTVTLKKVGKTHINIHFNETENNCSADYQLNLEIYSEPKEEQGEEDTESQENPSQKIKVRSGDVRLSKTSFTYNGKARKPGVKAKDRKGNVIKSSNYTVKYSNNKNVGKAIVTITFKGNYTGKVKKTFTIVPKGTVISKIQPQKKGFTAKWKKQASQVTGYELQYALKSNFKNPKTVKNIKAKITSKKISKLKAGKKYYVRIRTYKTVKGKKYYSSWSKSKSVKIKK